MISMTGFSKQGSHLKWEVPQRRLKHHQIIDTPESQISFLIKSVYDLLPTPANKNKWYSKEEKCTLCGEEATLNHILSSCRIALAQGRYTWRHNKVLSEVANSLHVRLVENCSSTEEIRQTSFVKEGEKPRKKIERGNICYLSSAKDWTMRVDLESRLKIPEEIVVTSLRPDVIVISKTTKQL